MFSSLVGSVLPFITQHSDEDEVVSSLVMLLSVVGNEI